MLAAPPDLGRRSADDSSAAMIASALELKFRGADRQVNR
jgi:hypothetical protein